jgi:hypothetical protein
MENENLSRVATEIPNPKPLIYDKFKVIDIE